MTTNFSPQQIQFLDQFESVEDMRRKLESTEPRRLTSKQIAYLCSQYMIYKRNPWDYEPSPPRQGEGISLEHAYAIARTPTRYLDHQATELVLQKELGAKHMDIWNVIKDQQPHKGDDIAFMFRDTDHRKKLSDIRKLLNGETPFYNRVKSIYYLPDCPKHVKAVYQLKQRET